jgi:hypothetical protein
VNRKRRKIRWIKVERRVKMFPLLCLSVTLEYPECYSGISWLVIPVRSRRRETSHILLCQWITSIPLPCGGLCSWFKKRKSSHFGGRVLWSAKMNRILDLDICLHIMMCLGSSPSTSIQCVCLCVCLIKDFVPIRKKSCPKLKTSIC